MDWAPLAKMIKVMAYLSILMSFRYKLDAELHTTTANLMQLSLFSAAEAQRSLETEI